ncbi:inorganic phosphate transporter [bacterium]|nr:inorganic phosphate transporter [bacterium]
MEQLDTLFLVLAIAAGGYMAWGIGANDVANAMGTSVGSKALTLAGAVVVAAIFEFAGAFFAGSRVTTTISKNVIDLNIIGNQYWEFAAGMIAALFAAAIWLTLASRFGWPVSTTHSIVGAVIGFGVVLGGWRAIEWGTVGNIALSWIVSPISGAILAIITYQLLVLPIYRSRDPSRQLRRIVPLSSGLVFFLLTMAMVYKGLKNLHLDMELGRALVLACAVGIIAALIAHILFSARQRNAVAAGNSHFTQTESVFAILQVITASYMAFAHGANDVANAVGPLAAVVEIVQTGPIGANVPIPVWVLAMGGLGIVIGLSTYGYRVMQTIGKKITGITPSRGFAAELGCATTVLICSKMGLPISTTHTLVGAVVGVGLVRGLRSLDLQVVRDIALSWLYTIPFTAALTIGLYFLLRMLIP